MGIMTARESVESTNYSEMAMVISERTGYFHGIKYIL